MADAIMAGRVVIHRRTAWLLIGDLVVIALFVGLGELRHGGAVLDWAVTTGEFALAWLAVGIPLGAYGTTALQSVRRSAGRTLVIWAVAAPVGVAIRALLEPLATFSLVFLAVMLGTGLVFLLPWRALVAPRLLHP